MIAETIIAITALVTAGTALWREIRGAKKMSRAQIIGEGEKIAFGIVEAAKAKAKKQGKNLTPEQMGKAFKDAVYDYITNKGLKGFTLHEAEALQKSARMLAESRKVIA